MSRVLRYVWAFPATVLGLIFAAPCIAAGGSARLVAGVLEITAEPLVAALRGRGFFRGSLAITFGHVVLASEAPFLALSRAHERVHVRQYERWGVLFFPLYVLSSVVAFITGHDPYTSNRFEQAAARHESEHAVA